MPNYYSIKFGVGIADANAGRTTTLPTGAYTAANSYPSVYDLFNTRTGTTAPVAGDILLMPNGTTETWAVNRVLGLTDGVILASTKAALRQDYEAGAIIQTTASANLNIHKDTTSGINSTLRGVTLEANDKLTLGTSTNNHTTIEDCTLELTAANDLFSYLYDGGSGTFKDVDFKNADTTSNGMFKPTNGFKLKIQGGSIDNSRLFDDIEMSGNGGCHIEIDNMDLSLHDTNKEMFHDIRISDDIIIAKVSRCKIPAAYSLVSITTLRTFEIDFLSCDSGGGYYYFEYNRPEGVVKQVTDNYRDSGSEYDPNNTSHFSAEILTNDNVVEFSNPLSVKLIPAIKIDLTSATAADRTLTMEILQTNSGATPTSLTDKQLRFKAIRPAVTDLALGVEQVSYKTTEKDILDTGTTLDTSTEVWTDTGSNPVEQKTEIVLAQNTGIGMDSAIIEIWVECSVDVTTRDSGNGRIFVDLLLDE